MAGRTLAQMVRLDAPTTEDAPVATWDWIECGCGVVFYGLATRRRCMACRTGAVVVCEVEEEEQDDMRGIALGLDEEEIRRAFASGMTTAEICREVKVSATQFTHWCYRNKLRFPGVPTPNTAGVALLQSEIDATIPSALSGKDGQWHAEAPREATTEVHGLDVGDKTQDTMAGFSGADAGTLRRGDKVAVAVPDLGPVAAILPNPFRAAFREGRLILPIRIEGSRIVLREPEVEGDITEVEAAHVLAWLRGWAEQRKGVEIVVEAS